MNNNHIITKRNELISKASFNMDYLEQLLFLSALSKAESKALITPKDKYTIDLAKLSNLADINKTNIYKESKKSILKLFNRRVTIPEKDGSSTVTGFIHSYNYHDGEGKISVSFSPEIIPYISQIKDSFVSYKFKQIAKFKCSYAVRLYELLVQRLDISNQRILELSEIRYLFKLGKSYERYNNLIQRVISPAIKDINTYSDINVFYKEIRTGRKVTALEFNIEALEPRPTTKKQIEQEALPGETYSEVKERLKAKEEKKESFWKKIFK